MPSDRRWVPIPVDDPNVTHLSVDHWNGVPGETFDYRKGEEVPVPPDDQLAQDVDAACRGLSDNALELLTEAARMDHYRPAEAARLREEARQIEATEKRLRAAFQLGEGE